MLLTLSTTHQPATDLGFLLFKHPERAQSFELNFGEAHVFYPEASEERCTAAMLLELNAVELVRGERYLGESSQHYVTDRPYTANSYTSVALVRTFNTAMSGRSRERQELADSEIPLEIQLSVVGIDGETTLLERLFDPLGYQVDCEELALDPEFSGWGVSNLVDLRLDAEKRLQDVLSELYVLLPVLDGEKHYWVDETEVDKLARHGEGWLGEHPEREMIMRRYLRWQWDLVDQAREALSVERPVEEAANGGVDKTLHDRRLSRVARRLVDEQVESVADLGCGEGRLLEWLVHDWQFENVLGLDVSYDQLRRARDRLKLDRKPPQIRESVDLVHGSLLYRDRRLEEFEAATLVEVIEHVEPERLEMLERVVFGEMAPKLVFVTTPNREYNVHYDELEQSASRHDDHRFEWKRGEFQVWATRVTNRYDYEVAFEPIGELDADVGAPSQLAVFRQ